MKSLQNLISVLIKRGADFNLDDFMKMRADDLALKNGAQDAADLIQQHRHNRLAKVKHAIDQDVLNRGKLRDSDLCTVDSEGYTLIMKAAMCNAINALDTLLEYVSAPINAQHEKTLKTALSYAAGEGHVEAVEKLIETGAETVIRDIEGDLALHHALNNNRIEVVTAMLDKTACLHGLQKAQNIARSQEVLKVVRAGVAKRQREIVTPVLFECSMNGDAQKLFCTLEDGDCVNPLSGVCQWPLYLAVENEHIDVVKLLCENGADLMRKHNTTGNTVFHLACSRGYYDICKYLLTQYSAGIKEPSKASEKILNHYNYDGKTPVVLAGEKGHSRVLVLLLQYGASTAILDQTGNLYECTEYEGCQNLIEKHREQHTRLVMNSLLCKDGLKKMKQVFMPKFDHNLRDQDGDTPLMVAAYHQKIHIIDYLLESAVFVEDHKRYRRDSKCKSYYDLYQADSGTSSASARTNSYCGNNANGGQGITICHAHPDVKDYSAGGIHTDSCIGGGGGNSWLQCPTCSQSCCQSPSKFPSSENLQRHLLDSPMRETIPSFPPHCTIPEAEENNHEPTATEVEQFDELLQMLQMRDTDLLQRNGELPAEDDPEKTLQDNMSSLFESIKTVSRRGSIYVTDLMISHLCAVNTKRGVSVFHRLIEGGDNVKILDLLLRQDTAGINIQDNQGLTPLHVACLMKRKKIVERLVTIGYVDLNARSLDGKLPEEMTEDENIIEMVQKARKHEPPRSFLSPLLSLTTSLFGSNFQSESSLGFDGIENDFGGLKRTMNHYSYYNDRNLMMSFY